MRELFTALSLKRWWIIASIVVCTALAIAYVSVATPVYRASTILAPAANEDGLNLGSALGQLGGIAALAGVGGGQGAGTEEALAVLRSREFTERFLREEAVLPRLYPKLWDTVKGEWNVPEGQRPTYAKAYRRFHTAIRSVQQDKKTGFTTLNIDWHDREQAADWANKLVARINEEMRRRAMSKAVKSLGFLERELQTTVAIETRDAISRLMESQIKQRMLANVTEEYAFRVVDRALPADADEPVRPKKLALIAIGFIAGSMLGVALALWRAWRRPSNRR
ncbi:MAG: Wzz/FepE/Etk N-terminal domain-containing protein [Steroidobacteraceae bacterium]